MGSNQDADIVTQDFHQYLVDLSGVRLGPDLIAELGLDHVEGGLDVAALMVVAFELGGVQGEHVIHLSPQLVRLAPLRSGLRYLLEVDVRHPASVHDRVRRDLADVEVLRRRPHKTREIGGVRRLRRGGVGDGHDVGLDADHDV